MRPSLLPHQSTTSTAYAWYAVFLLFLTNVLNQIDRNLVGILIVPIKRDLGVSDTAIGFLVSAFVVLYALLGIPMAYWADRGTRRSIVALSLSFWSAMTAAIGFSRSVWEFAAARLGVGAGEAGSGPASHSMLADYFPPEKRGRALALLGAGGYVGGSFGWLAGAWLEQRLGWRSAFMAIGAIGVGLGLLIRTTLREPARGRMDRPDADLSAVPLMRGLRTLLATRSYVLLQIGGALHVLAGYGVTVWLAAFFHRVHGLDLQAVSPWLATTGLVCGISGAFLGGWISDRLARIDARWYLGLPIATTLVSMPFTALFLLSSDSDHSLAYYVPHVLVGAMYSGPIYAMTQAVVNARLRALAAAVHLATVNLVGLGLGPPMVGALSDALRPELGEGAIRYTMLLASLGGHFLACIVFAFALRFITGDVARQSAPSLPGSLQENPT
jgi:predicted MFS family arabinose efflux permease